MDEPPSPLLKSRIPRETILVDRNLITDSRKSQIFSLHRPLQKGIIYYQRDHAIFEHNIHSSGKYEPQIIVPKHPTRRLDKISFVPVKGDHILLFATYYGKSGSYLHLSIHEIRSDTRVGPALWYYNDSVDGHFDISHLELIKSAENSLGIILGARFDDHWKLFDISITDTDTSDYLPLIESGRIDFIPKLHWNTLVILSPDRCILLNVDLDEERLNETINIYYSDSGDTNNMNFSFITRMSIPIPGVSKTSSIFLEAPRLAFSADGSKFAMAMAHGRVSVWDIRSKDPLKTFMAVPKSNYDDGRHVRFLQFSSGKSGREALVYVERNHVSSLDIIHVIDATSFETEEILLLDLEELEENERSRGVGSLFFDLNGETLYAELAGTLYEWDLRKNNHSPEWWIGE